MRNSATMLSKVGALAALLMGAAMFAPRASAADFTDDFAGDTLKAQWTVGIPVDGPTVTVNNGLEVYVPAGPAGLFDDWNGANNAPRIEMPAPTGNFAMSARVTSVLDPEANPATGNTHSALKVQFSDTDKIYWGVYNNNGNLQIERSGVGSLGNVAITGGLPVSLQIFRIGDTYHFYYRQNDADPWTELKSATDTPVTFTSTVPPVNVGIMQKTWGEGPELTAKWASFSLIEGDSLFSNVTGTVTTNGPSPSKLNVQSLDASGGVLATAEIGGDGKYTISAPIGNATVRLVGSDLLSPPADTSKTVAVQAGQTSTLDFSNIQVSPDLNSATSEKFSTSFTGPNLDPQFSLELPRLDPAVSVNNGLHINVPAHDEFDYWNTVDNSPKARIPAPDGDWTVSARLGSTDPDGNPIAAGNLNVYLSLNFAQYDSILFTQSLGDAGLEALRTGGADGSGVIQIGESPVWVQIRKVGNKYSFYYKDDAAGDWLPFASAEGSTDPKTITDVRKVVDIELGLKTWDSNVSPAVNATFGEFNLEATSLTSGVVSGTLATGGPDPSKAVVQVKTQDGKVFTNVPIAANGNYSVPLAPGSYTLVVLGNTIVAGQAAATQAVTVAAKQNQTVNFTLQAYPDLTVGSGQVFSDPFNTATLNPAWTFETPSPGPTATATTDGLNIHMPGTAAFDLWLNIPDNAARLTLPNPAGDFVMSATFNSALDPDTAPFEGKNFHSGLFVDLGPNNIQGTDAIMWGAYRSNGLLRLERSGFGYNPTNPEVVTPVQLQIRRSGYTYTFWYRQESTDPWTQYMNNADPAGPVVLTATNPAERIGIFQKTWENLDLTANWTDFSLETSGAVTPPVGCKGDANADGKVDVNDAVAVLRHATGIALLTGQARINADINGDGSTDAGVNVEDAVKVLQYIVGIPNTGITGCTSG